MNRRSFVISVFAAIAALVAPVRDSEAGSRARRRSHRRRVRRHIRRRIRRRVVFRRVRGRGFWVVPVGLVVGWELVHHDRVVVVHEVHFVEKDGVKTEVAVVHDASGKAEEIPILREDNGENGKDLEGSRLPDDDKTSPGVDVEIEEEVDEEDSGGK